jgi:thiol-disulfide isomerase/thioredoxin
MRLLFSFVFAIIVSSSFSQSGYKLDFKIKGWKDTTAYLGYYQGEATFLKDTAKVNSQGEFSFDGKKPLPQGVYFTVLKKTKIFDFVVSTNQHFKLETNSEDYYKNMKVTGDEDNTLFFGNLQYESEKHAVADPYIKIIQDSTLKDEQKKKEAREAFGKVRDEVMKYQNDIMAKYPATLTARIFKANKQIEIPDPPKKANGTIDSTFQLRYYRQHFFDNLDLADDALTRLPQPIYQQKVKEYLSKLFLPQPDTITRAIEDIVAKARKNPETYKYLVYHCVYLYQTPEIMGLDEVFVNLYNKYFASGEMDYWANAQVKKSLKDYSDKVSRAMIGRIGPNLLMQDVNLQPHSLYDIKKKYTIIYFFDPDCGHCRQESPKLVDFYNKNKVKYNLEVFAVSSDTSIQKLKNYIKEMKMTWVTVDGPRSYLNDHYTKLYYTESFPTVYVLDEKKKVIARKLPVEKLDDFLSNYEKFQKKKPATVGKGT